MLVITFLTTVIPTLLQSVDNLFLKFFTITSFLTKNNVWVPVFHINIFMNTGSITVFGFILQLAWFRPTFTKNLLYFFGYIFQVFITISLSTKASWQHEVCSLHFITLSTKYSSCALCLNFYFLNIFFTVFLLTESRFTNKFVPVVFIFFLFTHRLYFKNSLCNTSIFFTGILQPFSDPWFSIESFIHTLSFFAHMIFQCLNYILKISIWIVDILTINLAPILHLQCLFS